MIRAGEEAQHQPVAALRVGQSESFAPDRGRLLVSSQSEEGGMPEVAVGGPFDESNLGDEGWPQPLHLTHLLGGDAAAPVRRLAVRQIDEGAPAGVTPRELRGHFAAQVWRESGP